MMKRIPVLLFVCCAFQAFAQFQTTLPFMGRIPQSAHANPAFLPAYSSSFSLPFLPNIGAGASLHTLNLNMMTRSLDDSGYVDLGALYDKIPGKKLDIHADVDYELFHLRFRSRKWFYGININQRAHVSLSLSKDLLGFAIRGNGYFDGRPADFSQTSVSALAYNELGFSMARRFNRLTFGARVKLLNGTLAAFTQNHELSVTTPQKISDPLAVRLNGTIYTSGLPLAGDSVENAARQEGDEGFEPTSMNLFRNMGFAADLGVTYELSRKLKVAGAVCDWGYINWTNRPFAYRQKDVSVSYGGIAYGQINNDTAGASMGDSLGILLKGEVSRGRFSMMLPTRVALNAFYELNAKNVLGLMVQGRYFNQELLMAYTANYLHRFRSIDIALNYSMIGRSYTNIGLGLMANMGAFQFYLIQDDILWYVRPDKLQVMNIRLGFNFVMNELGRHK